MCPLTRENPRVTMSVCQLDAASMEITTTEQRWARSSSAPHIGPPLPLNMLTCCGGDQQSDSVAHPIMKDQRPAEEENLTPCSPAQDAQVTTATEPLYKHLYCIIYNCASHLEWNIRICMWKICFLEYKYLKLMCKCSMYVFIACKFHHDTILYRF